MKYLLTGMEMFLMLLLVLNRDAAMAQTIDAREIVRRNDHQMQARDEFTAITMVLLDRKGNQRRRKVERFQKTDAQGNKKILIRFLSPPDIKGTGLLTLEHHDRDDEQWLYLPAMRKIRRISPAEKSDPFVATDFSYQDLKSEEMEQYDYRLMGEDTLAGFPCYRVEAVPNNKKEKKASAYGRRILWFDRHHYLLIQAHFYDKKGRHFKTFHAEKIRKIANSPKWRAWQMVMENLHTGHKTQLLFDRIEINRGTSDQIFTLRYLKRGR